jgi:hypothetical protein
MKHCVVASTSVTGVLLAASASPAGMVTVTVTG